MLNNQVKSLRRANDITQEALAKELGVSRSTVAHMERGGEISGSLLLKVANYFDKDPRDIFFVDGVRKTTQGGRQHE